MSSEGWSGRARWRRLTERSALALLGACSLMMGVARAQDLADEDPSVPMQQGSLLTLWSARSLAPGGYALSLGVDARSLELPASAGAARGEGRGSASRFALLGSLGVWRRIDISAGIAVGRLSFQPIEEQERGVAPAEGVESSPGADTWFDLRLVPRLQLWGDASGNALAVLVPLWLPRGEPTAYAEPGLRLGPRLAVNVGAGALGVTLNAGYVGHPAASSLGTAPSDFARLGAGLELRIQESVSLLGELCNRWWPRPRALGDGDRFASEAHLGGRYMSGGWALQIGAGRGITGDRSEVAWRMLANVSFSSEAFDEPVAVASPADTTPIAGASQATLYPNESADWRASAAAPEMPTATMPSEAASATAPSEPQVPAQAGSAELEALPVIDVVLYYARYQIRLDGRQLKQLKKVARELRAAGPHVHVVVEGHTDDTGPRAFNRNLSRLRASGARHHLMQLGIPRKRIVIKAYGATKPVPGKSQPGAHRKNRRVEFRLVRSSPDTRHRAPSPPAR